MRHCSHEYWLKKWQAILSKVDSNTLWWTLWLHYRGWLGYCTAMPGSVEADQR